MRSLIVGASLAGVAVVLQGCGGGGGGGGHSDTCMNFQMDVVTQNMAGYLSGTTEQNVGGIVIKAPIDGTVTEGIDMEKWNFRMDLSENVKETIPIPGIPPQEVNMKVDAKVIFEAVKKTAVIWYSMTNVTSGKVIKHDCMTKTEEQIPPPATLTLLWKSMVLPKLQAAASCGGNDGTYDTWKFAKSIKNGSTPLPPPLPPMPKGATGTITGEIAMDKNFLVHSLVSDIDMEVPASGKPSTTKSHGSLDVSYNKASGPTEKDLDYSTWGKCHPSNELEIESFFMPAQAASPVLQKLFSNGVLNQFMLATLKASKEPQQEANTVVV